MDYLLAAVDLGSNSFRLSIGRVVQREGNAQIYAIDRLKESVRLAAGLDENNVISEEAIQRAVTILKRFGERLSGFHPNRVRAVATNTFRIARNVAEILPRAEEALGFPIEVIAGQEEARLIFSGITNELPPSTNRRLMIDIGGGSTEVIIGKGFQPLHMSSLYMGCVSYTRQFFPDGRITEARMQQAQLAARRELEGISKLYCRTGWQEAYGSSGTAKGILAVLIEGGMSKKGITLDGMEQLKAKLVKDGKVIMSELPGLKNDRALVLAGGLAIMMAAFQELKIKMMMPGEGALRVGVLYDLLGRDSHHDKRDETVRQFLKRYHVDIRQSARVKRASLDFFQQLQLTDGTETQELERTLGWAADLHEIGISIAHSDYHKHSAYILEHADMPGFSNDDQARLAMFTLGHMGKVNKLQVLEPTRAKWLTLLCLRLAVLVSRRRDNTGSLPITVKANGKSVQISADRSWLQAHPLTEFSLKAEKHEWEKAGFNFELIET
ncbi:exopolyphosphatase [Candidimonas sp. SYP-B2681]|uniref:exopolyphosphatase n=1 Tax=Candidimonas sp. SYP-B2681 TaxID=2497686 RepID=UPI000F88E820|nr:exopolyphosphatase [Candidimonas sp. SYP-B2681]RTZ44669.1 exopolyphosphatase [Candidimonas sp. SYP-B2681]